MILVGTFCVRFTRSAAAFPFNTFIISLRGPVSWWVCVCNVHAFVDQTVNQSFQLISSTKFPIRFHLPAVQQIEKYNFVFFHQNFTFRWYAFLRSFANESIRCVQRMFDRWHIVLVAGLQNWIDFGKSCGFGNSALKWLNIIYYFAR